MLCATAQSCPGPPPTHTNHSPIHPTVIADSGCTAHFCTTSLPVTHKRVATRPIAITNPNGTQMVSSHTAYLDLPDLPLAARLVHIVPALTTKSLLSIPQLCTNGCKAELDNEGIRILRDDKLVLAGTRCLDTGLWHIDVTNPVPTPKSECDQSSPPPNHHSAPMPQPVVPNLLIWLHLHMLHYGPHPYQRLKKHLIKGTSPTYQGCHNSRCANTRQT
jgi:hypothetical protein